MSYRELWVLINRLPQESWTQTALRDAKPDSDLIAPVRDEPVRFGPWSLGNYQLADLRDDIRRLQYVVAMGLDGIKTPDRPPDPVPRPGAKPARVRALTASGLAYLRKLHSREGGD